MEKKGLWNFQSAAAPTKRESWQKPYLWRLTQLAGKQAQIIAGSEGQDQRCISWKFRYSIPGHFVVLEVGCHGFLV
jgi:hypothetical protein